MNPAKLTVEFIGTFFLVLTIGMTVIQPGGAGPAAPLAIAAVLTALVYAGFNVSGAQYNPAVTLAVLLRGRMKAAEAVAFVIVQLLGALLACAAVLYIKQDEIIEPIEMAKFHALLAEFLFAFALVFVILQVATTKAAEGNQYYGLAIGAVVLAGAAAVGPVSGGAFNPAVAVALVAMGLVKASDLWIHLVGDFAGAIAAAGAFRALVKDPA